MPVESLATSLATALHLMVVPSIPPARLATSVVKLVTFREIAQIRQLTVISLPMLSILVLRLLSHLLHLLHKSFEGSRCSVVLDGLSINALHLASKVFFFYLYLDISR